MISSISISQAQQVSISGTITDTDSNPLPGVTVFVKGTKVATSTSVDGFYAIKATVTDTLVYRHLGFNSIEKIVGENRILNIEMKESDVMLEEVVVGEYETTASEKRISSDFKAKGLSASRMMKRQEPKSGQLTAGELNDIEKWSEWLELKKNENYTKVVNDWGFKLTKKITVSVFSKQNMPISNVVIYLVDEKNQLVQTAKTDVFGRAIVFKTADKKYTVQAVYNGLVKGLKTTNSQKDVKFVFEKATITNDVDILFTIDATGSMGDEISYLKSEIQNIISRIDQRVQQKRVGLTFYRDKGEEYIVKDFAFTTDIKRVKENLSKQYASGGGDYEEAVERALEVSMAKSWNKNAKARLLFLVLDAPPHLTQENVVTIKKVIKEAQHKGIKIIPIVASGADKTVEFLMRSFSVATNGTYVFLTDDSGIGNSHIKPSAKNYKVEKLNDLIVRLIEKYTGFEN